MQSRPCSWLTSQTHNSKRQLDWEQLAELYSHTLLNDVVPFWLQHAVDAEFGGLFTCIRDDGSKISTDKYMWSQCRAIWTFAALYNRIERRLEFLEIAHATAEFVLRHARDEKGWYVFQVTREGRHVQGAISVYTDFFATYGLAELYRATGETRFLEEALRAFRTGMARVRAKDFDGFAPYTRPEGIGMIHGIPMICLEVGQELAGSAPEADVMEAVNWALRRIMDFHVHPARRLLLEHLDPNGKEVDSPPGRVVVPGHGIESMWFVLHQARRRKDPDLVRRAVEVIHWMLDLGWDPIHGGLFLGVDAAGDAPWWKHAEKKLWWPHGEALYALLLAHELTGEAWCMEWYWKIHEWSFAHFPDREHGEWHQKLDRQGRVIDEVVALPVKDPFHLPRNLILGLDVLNRRELHLARMKIPTPSVHPQTKNLRKDWSTHENKTS